MSEEDKRANAALAGVLFAEVMKGKPGRTLDIGSRYPFLAHTLAGFGCEAWGMEPGKITHDLAVTTLDIDFENLIPFDDKQPPGRCDLITVIHVFEHFYDPVEAMRKLRSLVADDGRVFIRMPDNTVPGFERDLTEGHYTIHPYFHNLSSLTECLAQVDDCFVVESYIPMQPGQSNITLRPINRRPTIGLGMMVKNEERDLPRLLKSLDGIVDGGVILDTGSTDGTPALLKALPRKFATPTYTGASEQIEGDWKLINFAKARNEYLRRLRSRAFDWVLWMDADDELVTPKALNRARYLPPWALGMWIDLGGGIRQVHYRMWPRDSGITFDGWCHEYPILGNTHAPVMQDICIKHDAAPGIGESSNARNLRILERQYAAEPSARCAFYLANTHKDGGRAKEAAYWYHVRLGYGDGFRDEYLFSLLYLSRALRAAGDRAGSESVVAYALEIAPDWAEFRMESAYAAYDAKEYKTAIEHALMALDRPTPATVLWREKDKYSDAPARLISWSYQLAGDIPNALAWSEVAAARIPGEDLPWANRHRGLIDAWRAPPAPAFVKRERRKVALVRPGAIGDILMTLNLLPAFRAANPDTDIHYFCAPLYAADDSLGSIIRQAGADLALDVNGLTAWRKSYDKVIDLVGYPLAEGYPDKPMRLHLLEYFAEEMGVHETVERKPWSLPQLTIPRPILRNIGSLEYATMQTTAGWSKYKEWPHWLEVWKRLPFPVRAISPTATPKLSDAIAEFANARMHLGIDSFCNHLTNYLWSDEQGARRVPGVILWGSTQASAAGYPDNTNISLGLPCQPCFRENPEISRQPRGPCVNPPRATYADNTPWACMEGITVERVVAAALALWDATAPVDLPAPMGRLEAMTHFER